VTVAVGGRMVTSFGGSGATIPVGSSSSWRLPHDMVAEGGLRVISSDGVGTGKGGKSGSSGGSSGSSGSGVGT
jgi:hypothetical protein